MALLYSASAGGFFDDAIHRTIPDDALAISPARHRTLLDGQAEGRAIVPGDGGRPVLTRLAKPALADLRARAIQRTRREAARRIEHIAPLWRQMNDMRAPGPDADARFAAIDAIRAASTLIERQIASASAEQLAALDIAAHDAWPKDA